MIAFYFIQGHMEIVKFLLDNGADVNVNANPNDRNFNCITPLHLASKFGR